MSHLEPEPGPSRVWLIIFGCFAIAIGLAYGIIGIVNANNNPGLAMSAMLACAAFFIFGAALFIISMGD